RRDFTPQRPSFTRTCALRACAMLAFIMRRGLAPPQAFQRRSSPMTSPRRPQAASFLPRAAAALLLTLATGQAAIAQAPESMRIRGSVVSLDGSALTIKTRKGTD